MSKLPDDAVMVNIVRLRIRNFAQDSSDKWGAERYVAWIIPPIGVSQIQIVDLGAAEEIDAHVKAARQHFRIDAASDGRIDEAGSEAAYQQTVGVLSQLILYPLEKHLADFDEVIISPDGELWAIPWAALIRSDDRYLTETHRTSFVLSGREVAEERPDASIVSEPVIFADPNFDLGSDQIQSNDTYNEHQSRSLSNVRFDRLKQTAIEAQMIRPSIDNISTDSTRLLEQDQAQEAAFKALHRPQLLVLSTHGFFQEAEEQAEFGSIVLNNPLLRCGLALAGCNNRKAAIAAGTEDGILTGLEIVSTDLRGTELVVLSACETGVGDVRNGEGVAGLRQAFQLAGAEAVLATLWQIPDRESAVRMASFFKHLANGQSKAEALRTAQLELINKRRDRYGAAHPFYWAAFTLTGQ